MSRNGLIFFVLVFLVVSCGGPKYLVKQGQKYERARDYEQAVILYSEAYSKDPHNRDAVKGMKKAGQKLLNSILDDFYDSYYAQNYVQAIGHYQKADKFVGNLERRTVSLSIPDSTQGHYKDAVSKHVRTLYLDAARYVDAGNYSKASEKVREIEKYDGAYEGLDNLKASIEADPVYSQALDAYRRGEKGKAITLFMEVDRIYPDYRETTKFINELKSTSRVKLVMMPFENLSREYALGREVEKMTETELYKLNNPLLEIHTASSIGYMQNANASLPDDKTLASLGAAAGMDKILVVTVTDFQAEQLPRNEEVKVAYLRERVLYWDPYYGQSSTYQHREVKYREVMEETKITIQMRYRLISVATGTTTYTNVISKSVINQVRYADYSGITDDLYPTTGYISQNDLRNWRSRFTASNDKKPVSELTKIAEEEAVRELVDEMLVRPFE